MTDSKIYKITTKTDATYLVDMQRRIAGATHRSLWKFSMMEILYREPLENGTYSGSFKETPVWNPFEDMDLTGCQLMLTFKGGGWFRIDAVERVEQIEQT